MRHTLVQSLQARLPDMRVEVAANAVSALARLAETRYDAVISDIRLPDENGLVLLSRIRQINPETPTLLMTGFGNYDLAVEALRTGAFDFIQKPVNVDHLIASVTKAVRLSQLLRKQKRQQAALSLYKLRLERSRQDLRALTARLLALRDGDQRRLSAMLNEDWNQRLAGIALALSAIEPQLSGPPDPLVTKVRAIRSQVTALLADIGRAAHQLHPSLLQQLGLVEALEWLLAEFQRSGSLQITFQHHNVPENLSAEVGTGLFRAVQELVACLAEKAHGARVMLQLNGRDQMLTLAIRSHWEGTDLVDDDVRLPLVSLQERVRALQGTTRLYSCQPNRLSLSILLPALPAETDH
ncbi:ATP-binding response regulator [Candidatus Nitrospira bockiana]